MMTTTWAITDDVAGWVVIATAALLLAAIGLLVHELSSRRQRSWLIFGSGVLAATCVALATVRPVVVEARANLVGPRVVVLVDQSRRMKLRDGQTTRLERAEQAVRRVTERYSSARVSVLGFSEGPLEPLSLGPDSDIATRGSRSDLSAAVRDLAGAAGERPRAVVVVSDGRFSRPLGDWQDPALREAVGALGVPVHTVSVADETPDDASIRSVRAAGVAVAHQPLAVTVEVGCAGELDCAASPCGSASCATECRRPSSRRAWPRSRTASAPSSSEITLDRAGGRVLEFSLEAPSGRHDPRERHATHDLRRRARSDPPAAPRRAARRTTCARCAAGSRATSRSMWSRSSSCATATATSRARHRSSSR